MAPQHPSVILSGGKPQKKDLTSIAARRPARKSKSKAGKIRRPRRYKPGSKYNLVTSLTIANCSQLAP